MKSKNPLYSNIRGGFQGSFRPRRNPQEIPIATDMSTGKRLRSQDAMDKSQEKLDRQERINNKGGGAGKIGAGLAMVAVGHHINGLANNAKDKLAAVIQHKASKQSDDSTNHIIRFQVGRKSTSSVKRAADLYGSNNLQISNSLAEVRSADNRKYLSKSFGFNQKSIDFLNVPFFITVKDYLNLYQLMEWKVPEHGRRVAYGLAQEEFSNVKIRNSNSFHRIKFKVHVVMILDDDVTSALLFQQTFNKSAITQELGMIPKVYQITDRPIVNEYVNSVLTYKGCSVAMAARFKTQARIVKTFTKILNPGDTLDFRMTHHLGPGIRLDVARTYMLTNHKGYQPSGYFMIVEAEGTPCEGQELETGSIFQGSCPGWYNYEYTTGIKAVKHNSIISNVVSEDLNEETLEGTQKMSYEYAVKIHEREFLDKPPISYAADEIGEPGQDGKKFSVFTTSDERVVYSKSIYKGKKSLEILEGSFDELDTSELDNFGNDTEDDDFIVEEFDE